MEETLGLNAGQAEWHIKELLKKGIIKRTNKRLTLLVFSRPKASKSQIKTKIQIIIAIIDTRLGISFGYVFS